MEQNKEIKLGRNKYYHTTYNIVPQIIRMGTAYQLFEHLLGRHQRFNGGVTYLSIDKAKIKLKMNRRVFLASRDYLIDFGILEMKKGDGMACGYVLNIGRFLNIIDLANQFDEDSDVINEIAEALEGGNEDKLVELGYIGGHSLKIPVYGSAISDYSENTEENLGCVNVNHVRSVQDHVHSEQGHVRSVHTHVHGVQGLVRGVHGTNGTDDNHVHSETGILIRNEEMVLLSAIRTHNVAISKLISQITGEEPCTQCTNTMYMVYKVEGEPCTQCTNTMYTMYNKEVLKKNIKKNEQAEEKKTGKVFQAQVEGQSSSLNKKQEEALFEKSQNIPCGESGDSQNSKVEEGELSDENISFNGFQEFPYLYDLNISVEQKIAYARILREMMEEMPACTDQDFDDIISKFNDLRREFLDPEQDEAAFVVPMFQVMPFIKSTAHDRYMMYYHPSQVPSDKDLIEAFEQEKVTEHLSEEELSKSDEDKEFAILSIFKGEFQTGIANTFTRDEAVEFIKSWMVDYQLMKYDGVSYDSQFILEAVAGDDLKEAGDEYFLKLEPRGYVSSFPVSRTRKEVVSQDILEVSNKGDLKARKGSKGSKSSKTSTLPDAQRIEPKNSIADAEEISQAKGAATDGEEVQSEVNAQPGNGRRR